MSQLDQWQAHPSYPYMSREQDSSNRVEGDSSTFISPHHVGSSPWFSPYGCSTETAMPPPPPGIDAPVVPHSKRNTGYLIALVILGVLLAALGSLELLQVATQTSLVTDPSVSTGSHQASILPTQHAADHERKLTSGTIAENMMLTCRGCDDPVLTTIISIMVDKTNLRTIWTIRLKNVFLSSE
jgi:hypothetical protein